MRQGRIGHVHLFGPRDCWLRPGALPLTRAAGATDPLDQSADDQGIRTVCFTWQVTTPLRVGFGNLLRATRIRLDVTQTELARVGDVTRAYVSAIELGRANATIDVVERIARALGLELEIGARAPVVIDTRQRDVVHARCSAHVHRRLRALGLDCQREVEIAHGRSHGWVDLIAFDRATGTLYVIEVKTALADIGAVERQLAWYARAGQDLARQRGWRVRQVRAWLLLLASEQVERSIRANREVLRVAFPIRAVAMRRQLAAGQPGAADPETIGRGLALIDPSSRRREWLLASRADGRRGLAPFRDYADAAARWRDTDRSVAKPQDARSA